MQRVQVPPQILKDQEAQSIPSKRFCPPKFLDLPTALSLRKRRESFWQLCFGAIMRNYKCDTYLKTRSKRRSGEMQTELESSWFLNLTWSSINEFLSLLSRDISVEHCIKKLVKTQRAVVHHVSVANCGLTGLALLSFEASCAAHCGPKTWILFKNSNNPKDIPLSETRFEYVLDIANF